MKNKRADHPGDWTDADKAAWILANGNPKIAWIFERVGDSVYKRPMAAEPGMNLPPWFNAEREEITDRIAGKTAYLILRDEMR